ncbi:MAG: glycogen debranching enzyme, partial [Thiohalocapsa sp.]
VAYNKKHNKANGEHNRDGHNHNLSWNCGVEGPTNNAEINALRHRQAKNLMAILLLSQGVPMILAGDELLRTKRGNNNTYCQNNELSWIDWRLAEENRDMLDFTQAMIAFRKRHPTLRRRRFLTGKPDREGAPPDISWHGVKLDDPRWDDGNTRTLAFTLAGLAEDEPHLHVMLNMWEDTLDFALPSLDNRSWYLAVDTRGKPAVHTPEHQPAVHGGQYRVGPRSVVVLEGR